ncbi:MAG: hypothetical protein ABI741_02655 [Ferruginibacter sp.]
MNFYKLALLLSVVSMVFLVFVAFSPSEYMVLQWENLIFSAGILFPFLLFSWVCALFSIALNFIYAERLFFIHEVASPKRKKYLPALLCIPAILSFFWFCYKFYKGFTAH